MEKSGPFLPIQGVCFSSFHGFLLKIVSPPAIRIFSRYPLTLMNSINATIWRKGTISK